MAQGPERQATGNDKPYMVGRTRKGLSEVQIRREWLHHQNETNNGVEIFKDGLNWVVRELTGGTGITITDGGANGALTIAAASGITKATTLLSATFAIDSTGVKTVTTAHGLSSTPAIQDIQLTVTEDSNVDDWAFNLLKVESVDGTNVVAKINVSTASATGGATAKLAIMILLGV